MKYLRWATEIFKKHTVPHDIGVVETIEETSEEKFSPNMRALRLAMEIADTLLSMGVAASDVVSMALDVTDTYCHRKVQIDVSFSLITLSQDRGDEKEPLTLIRTMRPRSTNNLTIQAAQELVRDISRNSLPLDKAEEIFDRLNHHPVRSKLWLTTLGSAAIGGGVAIYYTGSPIIILLTTLIAGGVAMSLRLLSRKKLPSFYAQIFAAILITLLAASISWLGTRGGVALLQDINPTLIVIGGIVMLVAGLTIVSAVQDAIDEYFVTAVARILKVIMLTIGIVTGVLIGLYLAKRLGMDIVVSQERMSVRDVSWQYIGGIIVAAGYAISNHSRFTGTMLAGALGGFAFLTFYTCTYFGFSSIAASGIAAMLIGSIATLTSRAWRVPSISLISAGIIPLVPGMTLYYGLMQIVNAQANSWTLSQGVSTLITALMIALAIAAGASFGMIIGRPLRRTFVRNRNRLPRAHLSS